MPSSAGAARSSALRLRLVEPPLPTARRHASAKETMPVGLIATLVPAITWPKLTVDVVSSLFDNEWCDNRG